MFSNELSHFVTVILGYDERVTQAKKKKPLAVLKYNHQNY